MTADSPAAVLDCTGQRCPLPVIKLARAVLGQPPGTLVRLLADDPAALADVPAWCRMREHELVSVDRGADGVATFDVRAGGS